MSDPPASVQLLAWSWIYLLLLIEAGCVLVAVKLALDAPALGSRWFARLEMGLSRLARRRTLCVAGVGVLALAGRALILPVAPVPSPSIHDEFSYLLAAETFAKGRLANPTHPLWVHFEAMHIQHRPTYASMYPPAQGLVLAAGLRIAGHPFAGVWLSLGLMCAGICWMLLGWLPGRWALLGSLLAVIRLGLFSYWASSYWGGAVAASGGALVLGALGRLRRRACGRDAFLMGLGAVVLANSRPYEGALLCGAAGAALLFFRSCRPVSVLVRRVALPALAVMLPGAALMGYYNWRVYGDPLTLPYAINRATYARAPIFLWQAPRTPPDHRHEALRRFYDWELKSFQQWQGPGGFLRLTAVKLGRFWEFFVGPALTAPLLALPWVLRDRRKLVLLWVAAVGATGIGATAWYFNHYAAPFAALIWLCLVEGLRRLRAWRRPQGTGLFLARAIPVICAGMVVVRAAAAWSPWPVNLRYPITWAMVWSVPLERDRLIRELEAMGGRHLVVVRNGPDHDPVHNYDYLYNAADIDASAIVWAREMDAERNRALLGYFKDRRAWLLEADVKPARLKPYPPP